MLDELEAERLALDAFDGALEEFMADGGDPDRIEMVAAYTPDRLRDMVRTVHSHLRSRGQRQPSLEEAGARRAAGEHERLEAAARAALAELALAPGSATVARAVERLEGCPGLLDATPAGAAPEATRLDDMRLKGRATALSTDACEEYRAALAGLRSLALVQREQRDHALLRALLELYGGRRAGQAGSGPASTSRTSS